MALTVGQEVEVLVEKAASGGRMIARHDGEVLLVSGAIPGERVAAVITRAERRLAFADTTRVLEPSADRRAPAGDPLCGGCLYAHIDYRRQLGLKADIVRDAFTRIGRIPVEETIDVAGSPERGYRLRARFHVHDGRPGFYREGSRELCDAAQTGQVMDASLKSVEAAVAALKAQAVTVLSVELSENMAGDQRALHVDVREPRPPADALERAISAARLTGLTARTDTAFDSVGDPIVSDPLQALTEGRAGAGWLRRHPESFFQGNRFLTASLVGAVMDRVQPGAVLDLYAGVGIFAVALAAAGRGDVTAVEGDRIGGQDLLRNAAPFHDQLRVARTSVEAFLARGMSAPPSTLIVDPPRTGMSKEAGDAIVRSGAGRIIYVSCDAPTMAHDARRLLDGGYRLVSLRGFDLFPNTPHVETLGVFERGTASA
jgi:tRNA/tmRNA/rRNA uracil-C5-methylase (TrmA/RlmC/RlmD family)